MDLGEGSTGVRTPVGLGQQGARGVQKISITIIAANAHHYKYSILQICDKRLSEKTPENFKQQDSVDVLGLKQTGYSANNVK